MTEEEYLRNGYDRFNSPPPPIHIRPVKVESLKEKIDNYKRRKKEMEPTSVWKIENIDKIWITQDGDEISLLLKNRDDLTKIILTGDAIKNHNDNFITTLKADLEENEKKFRKLKKEYEKKLDNIQCKFERSLIEKQKILDTNRKLQEKIFHLEELKTPTIENFANEEPVVDNVNHPSHYTGKYECIDVMIETQGVEAVKAFCKCNAFKYIYRADRKNGLEDIKKARWYLDKFIELCQKYKNHFTCHGYYYDNKYTEEEEE